MKALAFRDRVGLGAAPVDVLEELAVVGVPIIATEFDTDAGTATQVADDLENFYRICFSHPSVEGIIMWGYEQNAWRWEGIVNSSTWVLNEAGVRYEALLDEWLNDPRNVGRVEQAIYRLRTLKMELRL